MNSNTIKFGDNAPTSVTFKYGNVTQCESQRGGDPYYRFDCEEGRINASKPLAEAIAANWPGSGGRVRITKRNARTYEVEKEQDGADYPLEMRQWDDASNGFVTIDMTLGVNGSAPAASPPQPQPQQQPQPQPQTPQAAPAGAEDKWTSIVSMMAAAVYAAERICPDSYTAAEREKVAVSMYMSAERQRVDMSSSPVSVEIETPPAGEAIGYMVIEKMSTGDIGEPPPEPPAEVQTVSGNNPPEDTDDLPF